MRPELSMSSRLGNAFGWRAESAAASERIEAAWDFAGLGAVAGWPWWAAEGSFDQMSASAGVSGKPQKNFAPSATDDRLSTGEDTPAEVNVLANDSDRNGHPLTVVALNGVSGAGGGTITLASGARVSIGASGTLTYDPHGAFEGLADGQAATETITYTISDGHAGKSTAAVTVTVRGVTDPPPANLDPDA